MDWRTVEFVEIARRYAAVSVRPKSVADRISLLAQNARTAEDVRAVRSLYLKSKRYQQLLETIAQFQLDELRKAIQNHYGETRQSRDFVAQVDSLEKKALGWSEGPPDRDAFLVWTRAVS